ncbi:hypothetical protein SDC9_190809 [bioreactor metagenome]|uniref:Uncharacterized protein n=1 Tax=bioreactor metagenome TaxID=1076179 RepID=A0A645HWL7_9ZZZZ
MAVLHAAGAGALAVAAGQAAVQVQLCLARRRLALQHLLDEVDAAARAVQLVAQELVGGAGGGAKAAVHAFAQDGFGLLALGRVAVGGGKLGLHGVVLSPSAGAGGAACRCGHGAGATAARPGAGAGGRTTAAATPAAAAPAPAAPRR